MGPQKIGRRENPSISLKYPLGLRGKLRERGQHWQRKEEGRTDDQIAIAEEAEGQERPGGQTRVIPAGPRSCAGSEWMSDMPLSSWWVVAGRVHALGRDREFLIPERSEKVLGTLAIPAGSSGGRSDV